ncbi:MAG: NirD/YgiW/YdeI family stress tolerance protein [Prolixibacteraceae bacterium]|nr:NirD/YgiW/YdeI family stress tolerance protein [Prolixibacteraceae bacterium]
MKQLSKIFMVGLFMLIAGYSQAQYKGAGSASKLFSVKQIKEQASKLDRSDAVVKMQGFIIEKISGDKYWFQDATGKICIEIDKKRLPAVPFDEKTELIIIGEVDNDFLGGIEVEAKQVEILTLTK